VEPVLGAETGNGVVEVVDHPVDATEVPLLVQRPAAYAVLVDEGADPRTGPRILLTRLSGSRTLARRGTWTLPGGGIDHGEHPLLALEREVYEETGLPYTVGPLLDISSRHFIGRSPNGRLEDFHALRLVYTGSVPADLSPQVIEVDGSTDKVAWIPVSDLGRINTVPTVRDSFAVWNESRGPASGPTGDR
jgi:8-oxo-dGTP diphosphatase